MEQQCVQLVCRFKAPGARAFGPGGGMTVADMSRTDVHMSDDVERVEKRRKGTERVLGQQSGPDHAALTGLSCVRVCRTNKQVSHGRALGLLSLTNPPPRPRALNLMFTALAAVPATPLYR